MRRESLLLGKILLCCCVLDSLTIAKAAFTDVTSSAGLTHVQSSTASQQFDQTRKMTGGAAAADYDGDGWTDLFITRYDAADILYRNRGDGTFEDVSASAGFTEAIRTNGAAWGDVDNDGDPDLYVTAIAPNGGGRHYLYINDGPGHFTEEAVPRGAHGSATSPLTPLRGFSAALGDYDRDGYLDLFVGDWGTHAVSDNGGEIPKLSRLLHNVGLANPGYFTDATDTAGLHVVTKINDSVGASFVFTPRFNDLDNDGWPDLALASDFGTSRLFWNNADGTFSDGTLEAGVGGDENGMGSTVADYDADGDLDWFVTSIFDPEHTCANGKCNWGATGNRLYRNEGNRLFSDQTDSAGVRDGGWGWGASFLDFDNDGDLDLAMTNGFIAPGLSHEDKYNDDPMRLWRNDGGSPPTFVDVAVEEGIIDVRAGKGLLTFDYDNDGDLDLFVANNGTTAVLYRNDTNGMGNWLKIDTIGTKSNRDGIGARVLVDPDLTIVGDEMYREVDGGSNYLSQNETTIHFGLGESTQSVDLIRITWPSGIVQILRDADVNQLLVTVEPLPEPSSLGICIMGFAFSWAMTHRLARKSVVMVGPCLLKMDRLI